VFSAWSGQTGNPGPAGFGGHEAAKQSVTEGLDELDDVGSERSAGPSRKSQQDATDGPAAGRERELSKVLVLRQDNPALRLSSGDHVAICQPRLFFGNRCNVVTGLPQRSNHGEVAALIGEESHWWLP